MDGLCSLLIFRSSPFRGFILLQGMDLSSFAFQGLPKTQSFDAVAAAVADAMHVIETVTLPPNPLAPLKTKKGASLFMYEKELQKQSLERELKGLDAPPPWGLKVNLANLAIGPERCEQISKAMILNRTVTTIDLSGCDLGDEGGQMLAHCLRRNPILQHLVLNGNFFGPETATAFADVLRVPECSLETVSLSCNAIGDKGALAIADALRVNQLLSFLNIRANKITDVGAEALLAAIQPGVNHGLVALWVNMNSLSSEKSAQIHETLVAKCPKPPDDGKKKRKKRKKNS